MDKWESIAERKIREAMDAGAFDNLSGQGRPIPLDTNPFEDPSMWMAHHLLKVNGFAPAWIEEGKDIDAASTALRNNLAKAGRLKSCNHTLWQSAVREFLDRAAELNRKILTYNLKCPSTHFHKRPLNLEDEIRAAQTTPR